VVIHRTDDAFVPVEAGRWMAGQIPGARFVELPGDIHHPWFGDMDAVIDEVEELVTRVRRSHEPDRALATVLFTDIVDSTRRAAQLGDRAWRELLERHDALARGQVDRFRGRYIKSTGDGMLARAALTTGTRTGAAIVKRSTSRGTPTTLTLGSSVWRHQLDELICHDRLMGDDSERCERCGTPLRVVILNGRQLRYEYSTYFDAGLVRMAEKVKMLHTAQRCEFAELLSTANPAPWQRKLDA
jgi:hypothetical protein